MKLKHFLRYGLDFKLLSVHFNKKGNKVVKHTGVGFAANRTLYFSSFYHYKRKVPKLFIPCTYDCLIAQGFFTKEMQSFEGPKLFYTLEPYVVFRNTTESELNKYSKEREYLSFSTPNRLKRLYYPALVNRDKVISKLEQNRGVRRNNLCCIVNRFGMNKDFDLLPKRVEYVNAFDSNIHIYGHTPWGGSNGWEQYSNYKGPCKNKIKTLESYSFNLCFENSMHDGYTTEKIIQALMAGAIPLYWGGGEFLNETIPEDCFINCRNLDPLLVLQMIKEMPFDQILNYRAAGINFLKSEQASVFTKDYFLDSIISRLESQL